MLSRFSPSVRRQKKNHLCPRCDLLLDYVALLANQSTSADTSVRQLSRAEGGCEFCKVLYRGLASHRLTRDPTARVAFHCAKGALTVEVRPWGVSTKRIRFHRGPSSM